MANTIRTKKVTFRMTEDEYETLRAKVEESGKNQQEFILACVLGKEIRNTKDIQGLRIDMKRIGNNLNQIARAMNMYGYCDNSIIEKNQKELSELWQLLRQYLQRHR